MLLLERKDEETLILYNFCLNQDKAVDFRKKKMVLIPDERRLLDAKTCVKEEGFSFSTNAGLLPYPLFELYKDKLDSTILPYYMVDGRYNGNYHLLEASGTSEVEKKEIMDKFYAGGLFRQNVVVTQDEEVKRYFLLCNDTYDKVKCDDPVVASRKRVMRNIIEIPESLYVLQMLQQGKFDLIKDYDMIEQLSLFDTDFTEQYTISEIQKQLPIIGNVDYIVKRDEPVLKLAKKIKNC